MRGVLVVLTVLSMGCEVPVEEDGKPSKPITSEVSSPSSERVFNPGRLPVPEATRAEVCADPCLMLTRYDLATAQNRFADLCCAANGVPGDKRCTEGFLPEKVPCEAWAELKACVLARYGHVFADEAANARFAKEPWYSPNPSFATSDMTVTAKRNTITLQNNYDACLAEK